MNRLRENAHLYDDEAEEWYCKYRTYTEQQETRITPLLQRQILLSNIAGYFLTKDKTRSFMFRMLRGVSGLQAIKSEKRR